MSATPAATELSLRISDLREQIRDHRDRIAARLGDAHPSALHAAIGDFLDFVSSYEDEEAYAAFERLDDLEAWREFFHPPVLALTSAIEWRVASELLADGVPDRAAIAESLASNPWGAYAGMAAAVDSLDLSGRRSFVMVGCGPLPDSLICVHRRTEIETLVGVDRDPAAIAAARQLLGPLELERVRLVEGDGTALDYGEFDVICPSVFARPRMAILARIAETARAGAVVVLRDPVFTGTLMFEPVLDSLPARLELLAEAPARPGRFMLRRYILGVRARPTVDARR